MMHGETWLSASDVSMKIQLSKYYIEKTAKKAARTKWKAKFLYPLFFYYQGVAYR